MMKSVIKSSIKSTYSFGSGGELHHLNAHGIYCRNIKIRPRRSKSFHHAKIAGGVKTLLDEEIPDIPSLAQYAPEMVGRRSPIFQMAF
jgi:hypothetical protein